MQQVGSSFVYRYRFSWLLGLCVWQLILGNVLLCVIHCHHLEHATQPVQFTVVCDTDMLGQQLVHQHGSVSRMHEPSAILPSVLQPDVVAVALLPSVFLAHPTVVSASQIRFQPPLPPPRLG